MAEFITRKAIVHRIAKIIEEAEEEIVLISPYINADNETKRLIENTKRAITIHVIYGKREKLRQNERGFFDERSVKLSYRKDLHAKCYLNEKEAILTSMNLYEYSQRNNDEMGILVSRKDDRELYEAIYKQAMEWKEDSSGVDAPATPLETPEESTWEESFKILEAAFWGFCIRCKEGITLNPGRPYCFKCYKNWNRYKNDEYKEKYCQFCGNEHETSKLDPLCGDCYKELKEFIAL